MTVLYPSPVFGPVHSRRLGVSLGVNLMPADGKLCSFDCIYCECGFNKDGRTGHRRPTRQEVHDTLRSTLLSMKEKGPHPDVITFAGNGEPTLHPDFPAIVDDVRGLRDELFPECKISVLSNATQILDQRVFDALLKVDNNILKLDTVSDDYIRMVDKPGGSSYDVRKIVERMREFDGRCIIQTMFMNGTHEGVDVSNVGDEFVIPWLEAVKSVGPSCVMIYTIDRETPSPLLRKATHEELNSIADKVRAEGIACQVSY